MNEKNQTVEEFSEKKPNTEKFIGTSSFVFHGEYGVKQYLDPSCLCCAIEMQLKISNFSWSDIFSGQQITFGAIIENYYGAKSVYI